MRLLLLAAMCTLQGCAAIGGLGITAEVERQRRADATMTGAELAERPPAPGDTLTLVLVQGDTLRGAVMAVTPDSLRLDAGAVALTDVERAERPWRPPSFERGLGVGVLLDVALVLFMLRSAFN